MKAIFEMEMPENCCDCILRAAFGQIGYICTGMIIPKYCPDIGKLPDCPLQIAEHIPIKPEDISKIYTGEKVGTCKCGEHVLEHENYCHNCGQKLN